LLRQIRNLDKIGVLGHLGVVEQRLSREHKTIHIFTNLNS
jgi:hypothetical protein